jgi:hypoxanthine phosphoribosyltransferase
VQTQPHRIELRPLLSAEAISARVGELGEQIAACYVGQEIVLLPVLSGSLIFVADLVRRLPLDMAIGVCGLSSYRGPATRPDGLDWTVPPPEGLADRHVLIVDDILDTGATLGRVLEAVAGQGPASLRSCVLLARRSARIEADFVGFRIGGDFVVGYGLDYGGRFRNLPYIAAIDRRAEAKS